tara:strand:- start:718 stop:897 length:180 start_codon:yes stop_codon:yes gene_type:complete
MRVLINDIKFLNTDLINLIENINARHIDSISLNDINQLVNGCIAPEMDIGVGQLVLLAD